MKFLTWCNNRNSDELNRLLNSAKNFGIDVLPIGEGRSAKEGDYEFHFKNIWLAEAIKNYVDDEIVMCTDSFDVIYLTNESEIKNKFLQKNKKIVYSSEYFFDHNLKENKFKFEALYSDKKFKFLNAGVMVGYVGEIKKMLVEVDTYNRNVRRRQMKGRMMDQSLMGMYLLNNPSSVTLDCECDIFWTTVGFEYPRKAPNSTEHPLLSEEQMGNYLNSNFKNGRLINVHTDSKPCLLHGPWIGRKMIEYVWEKLRK